MELTAWHKKQVAMLYHFTSLDYLKTLHRLVSDLINGMVDPLLDMAKVQGRDQLLISQVWGGRDTSQNWANNAWPFLKDLQISLAKAVAGRVANRFRITAVNECLRGVDEYSVGWMTPGEEEMLKIALSTISEHAAKIDYSLDQYTNKWDDYDFAYYYPAFAAENREVPKFVVRPDMSAETGQIPPQTGVYISLDDVNAAAQFVWTQHGGCKLRVANTFNEIGLAALATVGRDSLWFDAQKMLSFALSEPYVSKFRDDVWRYGAPNPKLAPSAVARSAFTTRTCNWVLVEPIPGQFEKLDSLVQADGTLKGAQRRITGGDRCVEAGFYFTPSHTGSRRFFAAGEIVPTVRSPYGETYWQWDGNQEK